MEGELQKTVCIQNFDLSINLWILQIKLSKKPSTMKTIALLKRRKEQLAKYKATVKKTSKAKVDKDTTKTAAPTKQPIKK